MNWNYCNYYFWVMVVPVEEASFFQLKIINWIDVMKKIECNLYGGMETVKNIIFKVSTNSGYMQFTSLKVSLPVQNMLTIFGSHNSFRSYC